MSDISKKLEMVFARTGEIDWFPPVAKEGPKPNKPIELVVENVEMKVGFLLKKSNHLKAKLVKSAWIDKFATYYGEFSEGICVKYQFGDDADQYFVVEQHNILNSGTPEMFIYPPNVVAYQKNINGGFATIVLPPPELSISFAQLVIDDMLIKVFFSWQVDPQTAEEILNSLA